MTSPLRLTFCPAVPSCYRRAQTRTTPHTLSQNQVRGRHFEELQSAVLRIRDVYPVSRIQIQGQKDSGSRVLIRIKEFKYFWPKKLFLCSRKYDPGMFIPDLDLDSYQSRTPNLGSRGQKGTGTRIRIRYTDSLPLHYRLPGPALDRRPARLRPRHPLHPAFPPPTQFFFGIMHPPSFPAPPRPFILFQKMP